MILLIKYINNNDLRIDLAGFFVKNGDLTAARQHGGLLLQPHSNIDALVVLNVQLLFAQKVHVLRQMALTLRFVSKGSLNQGLRMHDPIYLV